MKKYYTPELKEFHVGFEYEERVDDSLGKQTDNWIKSVWTENHNFSDLFDIEVTDNEITKIYVPNSVRVKYLDREDIESLGFKQITDNIFSDNSFSKQLSDYVEGGSRRLVVLINRNVVLIYVVYTEEMNVLFNGEIKNKSELNKILNKINII